MKAKVKQAFFDATGLHKPGETIEVSEIAVNLVEPIEETKAAPKKAAAKKDEEAPKKATKKK